MRSPKDCPSCLNGIILPHEVAAGHVKCAKCREEAARREMIDRAVLDLYRANSRVR